MPDGSSPGAHKILRGLLNRDAGKRLGCSKGTMFEVGGLTALKNQSWFDVLDWEKLEKMEVSERALWKTRNSLLSELTHPIHFVWLTLLVSIVLHYLASPRLASPRSAQVSPPFEMAVDGDEDLRHFHEEFRNMPLPRSVTMTASPSFRPKRCNSDTFRGFSFVQNDFILPERAKGEVEDYWKGGGEGDLDSESDCAR